MLLKELKSRKLNCVVKQNNFILSLFAEKKINSTLVQESIYDSTWRYMFPYEVYMRTECSLVSQTESASCRRELTASVNGFDKIEL